VYIDKSKQHNTVPATFDGLRTIFCNLQIVCNLQSQKGFFEQPHVGFVVFDE